MPIPDLNQNGWLERPELVEELISSMDNPFFSGAAKDIKGTGKGKTLMLFQAFEKAGIPFPEPLQTSAPDCVSHATSLSNDLLKVVEIISGEREEYLARTACEFTYSVSRQLIGRNRLGRGGGSVNAWALKGMVEFGVLARIKYGKVDLTKYSSQRSVDWGNQKLPATIVDLAKEFHIGAFAQIHNFSEAEDSIFNGFPLAIASSQGFNRTRDKEGFCKPEGTWRHSMAGTALLGGRRPGIGISNSWPNYLAGPKTDFNLPTSTFFCDADVFDKMCRSQDVFSLCDFSGYKLRDIDVSTW